MLCTFSDWCSDSDGSILCPPKEWGGCGSEKLALRRIFHAYWVDGLIKSAEELTINYHSPKLDFSERCPLCDSISSAGSEIKDFGARRAAYRENCHDNFLYCPDATQLEGKDIQHFQMHWMRGEPVIVRNVLENASGLSWDPMVMWRAFRGARKVMKEEAQKFKAIDCWDWCEVCALLCLNLNFILKQLKSCPLLWCTTSFLSSRYAFYIFMFKTGNLEV